MKTKMAKIVTFGFMGFLAVSCASAPKEYRVKVIDSPEQMQEQQIDTFKEFPYLQVPGSDGDGRTSDIWIKKN